MLSDHISEILFVIVLAIVAGVVVYRLWWKPRHPTVKK